MSPTERVMSELARTIRAFFFSICLVLAARELSEYAAKGNQVIADFNRAVQAETLQRLLPDPDAEY